MSRRLTAGLLSAVLGLAAVLANPASCGAACAVAHAQQADCCKKGGPGLSSAPCCERTERLRNSAAPATLERVAHGSTTLLPLPALLAPVVSLQTFSYAYLAAGTGPPGRGPLIAQHTSLLL